MTEGHKFKAGDRVFTKTVETKWSGLTGTVSGRDHAYGYLVDLDTSPDPDESGRDVFYNESELALIYEPLHEGVDWPAAPGPSDDVRFERPESFDHLQEWEDMLKAKKAQEDDFYARVESKTNAIRDLLVEKNAKYGDVALNPIHIFNPLDSANALKVRIDDKLARMKSLGERDDEDTVKDLIGYLVLYQIAKDKKAEEQK